MIHIGWTTINGKENAEKLARGSVENRLAACVQIEGPISSFYLWDGNLESVDEYRLTFKFDSETASQLESWLKENHPYEIPQWITVNSQDVSAEYWHWARESQGLSSASGATLENAIDLSKTGVLAARQKAAEAGIGGPLCFSVMDAEHLAYGDDTLVLQRAYRDIRREILKNV